MLLDMPRPVLALALAALDDPVVFEFAKPGNKHGPGDQGYPAVDAIERADIGHQFAQDERHPAHGDNFRCLRNRTELIIAVLHGRE